MNKAEVQARLRSEGVFVFKATGFSMRPWIPPKSLVSVAALDRRPVIGDVLLIVDEDGTWLCHRCIRVSEAWVQTKGDANPVADRPAKIEDVMGWVVEVITPWKSVRKFDSLGCRIAAWAYARIQRMLPEHSPRLAEWLTQLMRFGSWVRRAVSVSVRCA